MNKLIPIRILLLVTLFCSCNKEITKNNQITSPDENITVEVKVNELGEPIYQVSFKDKEVIKSSKLGFKLEGMADLKSGFEITSSLKTTFNDTWEMPWGEDREVVNNYNELTVQFTESKGLKRVMSVVFKVYNDGIGFRYEFPEQENLSEVLISEERTEFQLAGDHRTWWIPGDWDSYEHIYNDTKFSKIDAIKAGDVKLAYTHTPNNAVHTPVTMKTDEGLYLSFHEAALTDYSGMTLGVDNEKLLMNSILVGGPNSYKVKRQTPFTTPWRTIQISEKAGDLIESKLIVNLNEPNKLGDISSWFQPTKYLGIWWEMHVRKSVRTPGPKHGATTENAKKFIDFGDKHNIRALMVEGWNKGWENWGDFSEKKATFFDQVTPCEDYDLQEVAAYAKQKNVELIMHHETSSAASAYEKHMDSAFALMKSLDIDAVKTGYVSAIIPTGEHHHGQWMVNHYRRVTEKAAKNHISVNVHEPIKPTGIRRTYPNAVAREGVRAQEFNAWADIHNPVNHISTIAFTRMLAGPIDFTPGIFNIKLKPYGNDHKIPSTLVKQLAMYVVVYSPIQCVADLLENYEGHPAFQFIKDVGVDWEQSKVLNGEIGEYVTIARQEKGTKNWFVGSVGDETPRSFNLKLDFLEESKTYTATLYLDGKDAHWDTNPTAYEIKTIEVTNKSSLELKLASGGGAAISIIEKE